MRTDFSRKKLAIRKKRRPMGRLLIVSLFVAGCLVGGGSYLYYHQYSLQQKLALSSYFAKVKAYFNERKRLQQEEQVLANNNSEQTSQPVHFEFYTALPDMRVSPDIKPDQNPPAPKKVMQPAVVEEVIAKEVPPMPTARTNSTTVFDENELQKQITHEMTHAIATNAYALQLGVFRSQDAAEKFSQQLTAFGFTTTIKMVPENNRYRVQVGPFANKAKVKIMQQKLQKQGITSIVLMLNE